MSPSSTGDSPPSATGTTSSGRHIPIPSRDNFTIEVPNATLTAVPNGSTLGLKSPGDLKPQRAPSFTRESILGAAQKARNAAQASESAANGMILTSSDDGSNPLKRRNTDAGVDYPRRRATIAVRVYSFKTMLTLLVADNPLIVRSLPVKKVAM